MHLEHVNMTVADIDRSAAFYSRLLGLQVRWEGTSSRGARAMHIGNDHAYLALFEGEGHAPARDYSHVGMNHFGFVVEDMDAVKARLEEMGVTAHMDESYEPGRHVYFMDPDGFEVELVEYETARA